MFYIQTKFVHPGLFLLIVYSIYTVRMTQHIRDAEQQKLGMALNDVDCFTDHFPGEIRLSSFHIDYLPVLEVVSNLYILWGH